MTTAAGTSRPASDTSARGVAPARRSLLLAEFHRFTARRFIRLLVLLGALVYVGVVALMALAIFGNPSAEDLAEAQVRRDQAIIAQNEARERCLNDPAQRPPDVPAEEFCGPELTAETERVENYLSRQPFVLANNMQAGAVVVGVFTSLLAFLIGATFIGAEWSTRSIVALLFWEPRRLTVIGVKLLVTGAMAALFGVLAQASWAGTAQVLARTHGTTAGLPADFWNDVLAQQARCVALVTLIALLGFAIANVVRNTGASLGVGFVYFAIAENVVGFVRPAWQEWLITPNIFALLSNGGHRISVRPGLGQDDGPVREVVLTNLHGGLVIGGITAAIVAVGVILFKRRDLH